MALPSDATIDGGAVLRDDAGIADFERLRRREYDR
jgi:ATP-dependent DNA ligase